MNRKNIQIVIYENDGRIHSLKHNILLMKSQIKALKQQNKELNQEIRNENRRL